MTDSSERTIELSPALQRLIDERIDGIERALRGADVGRIERKQVVENVERQLLEMLAESAQQPTRRDVLQALARLDPPEAYLSDEERTPAAHHSDRPVTPPFSENEGTRYSRLALVSLGLLLGVGFFVLAILGGVAVNSEGMVLVGYFMVIACAIAANATGICALITLRRRPQLGVGFAIAAVVISAWILSIVLCQTVAALFRTELLGFFLMLIIKDVPIVVGLIWFWRASMKSRLVPPRPE